MNRPSLKFSAALAIFVISGTSAAAPAEKVQRLDIVDRAIELHGGELYEHSTTALTICSKSGCFDLQVRIDGERFEYVVETAVKGSNRKVRVTNETTERWNNGSSILLEGDDIQRARDFANARVYFPFLPYRLNDPSVFKQDLGLERWGDRDLAKVKVTFQAGSSTDASDEYLYWFDPETARLEQFAYSFGSGEKAGVRFRRLFNYRRVGGILFTDQENLGAEAPGIQVDAVTPEFVEEGMRQVSTVELSDIRVEPLN